MHRGAARLEARRHSGARGRHTVCVLRARRRHRGARRAGAREAARVAAADAERHWRLEFLGRRLLPLERTPSDEY